MVMFHISAVIDWSRRYLHVFGIDFPMFEKLSLNTTISLVDRPSCLAMSTTNSPTCDCYLESIVWVCWFGCEQQYTQSTFPVVKVYGKRMCWCARMAPKAPSAVLLKRSTRCAETVRIDCACRIYSNSNIPGVTRISSGSM